MFTAKYFEPCSVFFFRECVWVALRDFLFFLKAQSYNKNLFSAGSSCLQQECLSDYFFFYCISGCKILLNFFLTMKLIYRYYFKHFWIYICAFLNCIFKQCCCLISWFSSRFLSLPALILFFACLV